MKTMRKNNSFEEYIEAKTKETMNKYKEGVLETVEVR